MGAQDHQAIKIQEKINLLTSRLEDKLERMRLDHTREMSMLQSGVAVELRAVINHFNSRCEMVNAQVREQIQLAEDELNYLRELNQSQRLMMHDSIQYIYELEERLNNQSTDSGRAT